MHPTICPSGWVLWGKASFCMIKHVEVSVSGNTRAKKTRTAPSQKVKENSSSFLRRNAASFLLTDVYIFIISMLTAIMSYIFIHF